MSIDQVSKPSVLIAGADGALPKIRFCLIGKYPDAKSTQAGIERLRALSDDYSKDQQT